jgi:hypothetical protein
MQKLFHILEEKTLPKKICAQKLIHFVLKSSRWQHLFLGAFIFVRNFKKVIFFHILEEQTPKKNKKINTKKLNSKWPLYSRWLPKLNLLVKTSNHLLILEFPHIFFSFFSSPKSI